MGQKHEAKRGSLKNLGQVVGFLAHPHELSETQGPLKAEEPGRVVTGHHGYPLFPSGD